jgi:3-deoxy-D-manno-octulosonate 8-phosphate phosphatase KdsC-like HAD superfamily phosphatase
VADLAIDFCEDVPPLPQRDVEHIVELFRSAGAAAKISSIHVNGWFGEYDKLSMTERCLKEIFGIDIHTQNDTIMFVGDSPNDAPMFAFFDHSVGVANVKDFELATPPTWITKGRDASGFKELADTLLKTRI